MRKAFLKFTPERFIIDLFAITIIGLLLFTIYFKLFPVPSIDLQITRILQSGNNPLLLQIMNFISLFGNSLISISFVLIISLVFFIFSYKREALFILFVFLADLIDAILKIIINRPRPQTNMIDVFSHLNDPSFPSGHVVHYTVLFGFLFVLMLVLNKIPFIIRAIVASVSLVLVFTISVSRIYLGVHWFTDVLGGYFVGLIYLLGLLYFYFRGKSSIN